MAYEIAFGIGLFSFLLFLFMYFLSDEHLLLKYLISMFSIAILFGMPMAFLNPTCDTVVANQTVIGNFTSFNYTSFCYQSNTGTGLLLLNAIKVFYLSFITYIFIYLIYYFFYKKMGKDMRNLFRRR